MKTNYIEQAIRKAQQSGWQYEENAPDEIMYKWKVFCDPSFWSSLGKALGWGNDNGIDERTFWNGTIDFPEFSNKGQAYREIWRFHWHRFIDHLAAGKDPESYFKEILTP